MRLPIVPLFILLLPLLEIAGFVFVGSEIGVLPTLGLVIASCIAGAVLVRIQGFGVMTRIRKVMESGGDPSRELAHGVMILVAGILLLIPGFITDIIGLLLFLPPVRDLGWRFLRSRIVVATAFAGRGGFSRPGGPRGRTIDLEEDEYSATAEPETPRRRLERE